MDRQSLFALHTDFWRVGPGRRLVPGLVADRSRWLPRGNAV
jgi:hypothetical protein